MDRRTFLKILGGTAAGVAAAPLVTGTTGPLFIPAKNLEFGVPKPVIIVPTTDVFDFDRAFEEDRIIFGTQKTVPMMLVHDNYIPEHGGRLKAGSIVWEDEATAARWGKHNVAVRCDGMQPEIIPGRDYGRWGTSYPVKVTSSTSVPWVEQTTWEEPALVLPDPEPKLGKIQVVKRLLSQGWTRP